jgi:hypothetical protein
VRNSEQRNSRAERDDLVVGERAVALLGERDVQQCVHVRVLEHGLARRRLAFLLDLPLVRALRIDQQHEELHRSQSKGVRGLEAPAEDVLGDGWEEEDTHLLGNVKQPSALAVLKARTVGSPKHMSTRRQNMVYWNASMALPGAPAPACNLSRRTPRTQARAGANSRTRDGCSVSAMRKCGRDQAAGGSSECEGLGPASAVTPRRGEHEERERKNLN